ncbi:MAG: GNAT family N-acetyltransferase, partial [Syntrophorhabdaceae bacterium]
IQGHTPLFEVRKAKFNEILQIPALFESVYGGSYSDPGVYSTGYLADRISRGELVSIVAVSREGHVIGHCALVKDNDRTGIVRAAMSVVNYAFRNTGCESRMLAAVIGEARRRCLWGVLSQSVTHHVFAQKAGQKLGFKRIGLQVGIISDRRMYDGSYPAPGRRQSTAIGYLPLRDGPKITLYPPGHHRDFIGMLFREAGLNRIMARRELRNNGQLTGRSFMRVRMINHEIAQITIDRYGAASFRCVEEILQNLKARDIRYISMELPLISPVTATACSEFEQLGFFIAGIMPHSSIGDSLVLQYRNNAHMDYADIRAASETLATIKSYVLSRDPNCNRNASPFFRDNGLPKDRQNSAFLKIDNRLWEVLGKPLTERVSSPVRSRRKEECRHAWIRHPRTRPLPCLHRL